jgi:hypothetical protein
MAHDSSQDKPIADAICGTLEDKRIRCWMLLGMCCPDCLTAN